MAVQGRQLKTFVLTTTAHTMVLVVTPGNANRIRRIEDLKGAVVGLGGFGSAHHRLLEYLAARHGVPFGSMQVIPYGSGPSAIAALEHSKVDAGMINGSAFHVLKRRMPGIRVLADRIRETACARFTGPMRLQG
jgi:NitT/TauT family transport system substrate-binding protein